MAATTDAPTVDAGASTGPAPRANDVHARREDAGGGAGRSERPTPSAGAAGARGGASSRIVLVRMADPAQQELIINTLREAEYDARPVEVDALLDACSEAVRPAAVLLDGDVPALRDFTRLKQLRSLNDFGKMLVVYCQRRVDIGYVLQAMDAGAGVFLFTPIEPTRLLKQLRERLP